MAHEVALSSKIYLAQFDLSADLNAHTITHTTNLPEDTTYGDTYKQRLIGEQDAEFSLAGFMDLSDVTDQDTNLASVLATQDVSAIIASSGAEVGEAAEFGLIVKPSYQKVLQRGEVEAFSLTGQIANRNWVRGRVLWDSATSITGTANGAEVELSAASATQKLYVAIAVIAANLTTMTVTVESDTTGFPSTTVQKTFTAVTAVTSENPTPVDGAIADTFYRAAVTAFTGTSAQMIVVAGIQ